MESSRVCRVTLDGSEVEDLYPDLVDAEVCDEEDGGSTLVLKIAVRRNTNGTWCWLDEESGDPGPFSVWKRIKIEGGYESNADVLFDGYVTGLSPYIAVKEEDSYLLVWGQDVTCAMAQEEKIVAWPDKKYSDIATEIFQSYSLDADVEDSAEVHAEANFQLVQRASDWQFLRQLAEKLGFETGVRGGKGYFRTPELTSTPQLDLAAHFGPTDTNLLWFQAQASGTMPAKIVMSRVNAVEKKIEKVEIDQSPNRSLGEQDADTTRGTRTAAGSPVQIVKPRPVISQQEMEAFATGLRRRADWLVTGEGEVDGMVYGRALKSRALVLIKGVSKTWSGSYYVSKVVHHFTGDSYHQRFWVRRNATTTTAQDSFQTTGSEDLPVSQGAEGDRVETRKTGWEVAP